MLSERAETHREEGDLMEILDMLDRRSTTRTTNKGSGWKKGFLEGKK
jgi:hypothetical protein